MPEPNWRSNAARVTPSDSCPDLVESAAGANVLYSCTVSILIVQLYKYNTFDMYRNRHYTTPWSSLQAVNEFLISPNVFGQIWIQKYFGGQIGIEMYSLHSDVHFSNLMDADRLYNNFVGQEIQSQPTSENSELAADLCGGKIKNSSCYLKYTWLCTVYYVGAEHFDFCRYSCTAVRPYEKPNSYLDYRTRL